MFDTHVHSTFSCDSKMTIEQAVCAAKDNNIGIIITEHMDIAYPTNPLSFLFDPDEYFTQFAQFRSDKLLLGIELGLQMSCHRENTQIIANHNFDMVIGSIHVAQGIDVYTPEYYTGRSKQLSYEAYFQDMLDCVTNFSDFDTLGHIDYICRYAPYADTHIYHNNFIQYWEAICRALITGGKALELNTRRLGEADVLASLQPFYQLYKDLGGRYVTLGSDAHRPTEIGCRLPLAWQWVQAIGLTPVYFKDRQLQLDKP